HLHHFHPNGVSGVAGLAASPNLIHTWAESRYAALGLFLWGQATPHARPPPLPKALQAPPAGGTGNLRGAVTRSQNAGRPPVGGGRIGGFVPSSVVRSRRGFEVPTTVAANSHRTSNPKPH